MRVTGFRSVLLLIVAGCAAISVTLGAQKQGEQFHSLGDVFASFFTKASYVGATPISLARLNDRRSRTQLHGFSVVPPAGRDWYLAYSPSTSATTIQTVWFVRDPHLYSAYAKGDNIGARPSSLVAKLEFYGTAPAQDFADRVKEAKTSEWSSDLKQMLAFEARPLQIGALGCAEYTGRAIDRGSPPGFVPMPFLVTMSGRVCPHPNADGFAVDVGFTKRTREGEPLPAPDPAGDAFMQSLRVDGFEGPAVQDVLLMDRAIRRTREPGSGFWVESIMLGAGSLWTLHRDPTAQPALKWLTQIDPASNQPIERHRVDGDLAGSSGRSIWMFEPGSTTDALTTWRLDENAPAAIKIPVSCAPGRPVSSPAFQVGDFGVWLGCEAPVIPGASVRQWRVQRRLDPTTGAQLAEFVIAPGQLHGDSRLVWAEEATEAPDKPCRVHAIDPATNQLVRSLSLGSSECRHLTIVGNDAWLAGANNALMKFDLTSGRTSYSIKLPKGREALGLAVAGDVVWVSTTPATDDDAAGLQLGSEGGLLRFDRTTGAMVGRIVPTGTANHLAGVADGHLFLYDSEGAILRVRMN